MTDQDGENKLLDDLKRSVVIRSLLALVLIIALAYLMFFIGQHYACSTGYLFEGKCVSLVSLGYCNDGLGRNVITEIYYNASNVTQLG